MQINLAILLPLLGVVQGVIIVGVTLQKKKRQAISQRLFAGIVTIISWATLGLVLDNSVHFKNITITQALLLGQVPFYLIMLLGPLLWMYGRSLFEKDFKLQRLAYRHFYSVLVDVLPFVVALITIILLNTNAITRQQVFSLFPFLGKYATYADVPRFVSLNIYLYLIWKNLPQWKKAAAQRTFNWYKSLVIGFLLIDCIWAPFLIIYISPWQEQMIHYVDYYPIYYPIVALIYYLSIRLMTQNLPLRSTNLASDEISDNIALLHQKLEQEQLYQQSNLKLELLSQQTGVPARTISFILNHHFKKGFNDFINEYRIKAAIDQLNKNALENTTMEGIALDVGFSSRSTFYRAFKKVTGESPSAYLKK